MMAYISFISIVVNTLTDTRMMAYISLISIVVNTLTDLTQQTPHSSDNLLELGMMAHIFLQPSKLKTHEHTPKNPPTIKDIR